MSDPLWYVSDLLRNIFRSHAGSNGISCKGRRHLLWAALEGGKADIVVDAQSPWEPGAYPGFVESMLPSPPKKRRNGKHHFLSDSKRKLMCLVVAQLPIVDTI